MSSTTRAEGGSLAVRLTVWYSLSVFALLLASTGYLYWALARNLDREDDDTLMDQIHILQVLLRDHPDDLTGVRQEIEIESGARQHSRMYVRILDEQGKLVMETPGMAGRLPPQAFPAPVENCPGVALRRENESYRVMASCAALGTRDHARVIQVASDRSEQDKVLAQFRGRILPLLAAGFVFAAIFGYQIAKRGLEPISRITRTAQGVRSSTLHERIPPGAFPAELGALAQTFNEMLDRLEESFGRLSRFSADIAHELRTPLNNLRGEVEVALGKTRSTEEYQETLSSSLEEAGRLSRLIESLLFLARAEHPENQVRREPLDVARELEGVRDFYEAAAGESGVTLQLETSAALPADLDRTLLQRALGNLVENSLAHTKKGGRITLSASRENGDLRIDVADDGCGIAAEHLPRVFDRLYRVDRSRTAATGGAGLGLAIVKSIAELHGGAAAIASEPGKGTRVTLRLPVQMTKK